jgi:hypothetical protein
MTTRVSQSSRQQKNVPRSGQAMLIAVLSMGGAILGATTVAGFLMLYQIRATTDSENSAKALFAADAGVEWTLFDYYCNSTNPPAQCPATGGMDVPSTTFSNGASFVAECSDINGNPTACSDASDTVSAITIGTSMNSRRAFALGLSTATSTNP